MGEVNLFIRQSRVSSITLRHISGPRARCVTRPSLSWYAISSKVPRMPLLHLARRKFHARRRKFYLYYRNSFRISYWINRHSEVPVCNWYKWENARPSLLVTVQLLGKYSTNLAEIYFRIYLTLYLRIVLTLNTSFGWRIINLRKGGTIKTRVPL